MKSLIGKMFSFVGLIIVWLVIWSPATTGQSTASEDQTQIAALIDSLQHRRIGPKAALDPEMVVAERRKNLLLFEGSPYELNLAPASDAQILPTGLARVELKVHFQNALHQLDVPTNAIL
jgi:hypothetical protein